MRRNAIALLAIALAVALLIAVRIPWQQMSAAVTLSGFAARDRAGDILLVWETATELSTAGFYLRRGTTPDGTFTRISPFISANGDRLGGASYEFADLQVETGVTYYYLLEEIETSQESLLYGPVWATHGAPPTLTPSRTPSKTRSPTSTTTPSPTATPSPTRSSTGALASPQPSTPRSPTRTRTASKTPTASSAPAALEPCEGAYPQPEQAGCAATATLPAGQTAIAREITSVTASEHDTQPANTLEPVAAGEQPDQQPGAPDSEMRSNPPTTGEQPDQQPDVALEQSSQPDATAEPGLAEPSPPTSPGTPEASPALEASLAQPAGDGLPTSAPAGQATPAPGERGQPVNLEPLPDAQLAGESGQPSPGSALLALLLILFVAQAVRLVLAKRS